MVGLIVSDMEAALAFYDRLGVGIPDGASSPHVQIPMGDGITFFLDDKPHAWDPEFEDTGYRLLLEFYLETEGAVRKKHAEMIGTGARSVRDPYVNQFGMCFAMLEDPDGNTILLSGDADER